MRAYVCKYIYFASLIGVRGLVSEIYEFCTNIMKNIIKYTFCLTLVMKYNIYLFRCLFAHGRRRPRIICDYLVYFRTR